MGLRFEIGGWEKGFEGSEICYSDGGARKFWIRAGLFGGSLQGRFWSRLV